MGVLKRFTNIMSCKIEGLLNKSKDPIKDINKYIVVLEGQLGEVNSESEAIILLEKRKKREVMECEDEAFKMQRYAEKSMMVHKESDARRFLEKKKELDKKVERLKKEYALISDSTDKMDKMKEKLQNDIKTLKNRRDEAKRKLDSVNSGVESKLNKLEENADRAIFEAEALEELNNLSSNNNDLSEFDVLYEDNNKDVEKSNKVSEEELDDNLEELRRQLGL